MQSGKLSVLAAVTASVCCLGPLILAVTGLGTLGLGIVFTTYHWVFIVLGFAILGTAYVFYFREQKRCTREHCVMVNKRVRMFGLGIATLAVFTFTGLNLYPALTTHATAEPEMNGAASGRAQITIPVAGMTCVTCEIALEKSLTRLDGVKTAKASTTAHQVTVEYDPGQVTVAALIETIHQTGYQAKLQREE